MQSGRQAQSCAWSMGEIIFTRIRNNSLPKATTVYGFASSTKEPNANQTETMTIANAIKRLENKGFTVTQDRNHFSGTKEGTKYLVEFYKNGGGDQIVCIGVRHHADHSDAMTDYCATIFCRSLSAAIELANS
jgi:hypothetical protein